MKARVKPSDQLSAKTKAILEQYVQDRLREESTDFTRRLFKIAFVALNERFAFGKSRLMRFSDAMEEAMEEWRTNEEYWVDVDKRLLQLGMDLPNENYTEMTQRWHDENSRR